MNEILFNSKNCLFLLVMLLLTSLPMPVSSVILVTQVNGDAWVNIPELKQKIKLRQGSWLPKNLRVSINDKNVDFFVLCHGENDTRRITFQQQNEPYCPELASVKMRSTPNASPFVLLPNQSSLGSLDRVLWSSSKQDDYDITLYHRSSDGVENFIDLGLLGVSIFHPSGYYELVLKAPFLLEFPASYERNYTLEIYNLNDSRSSDDHGPELIPPIMQAPNPQIINSGLELLTKHKIDQHSELGKLTLATFLAGKGQLSEAYSLLSSIDRDDLQTQAYLQKIGILDRPGTSVDLLFNEYVKALEMALEDDDSLSVINACRGISSISPLLLSDKGKSFREKIRKSPNFPEFCSTL